MFVGIALAAASAAPTDPQASGVRNLLGLGVDSWAQLALAVGTVILAIVTYLSVRELRAQRRDAAKPHLVIVTHKTDVSFGSRSWAMSDGFEVSNFGSGYAYEAAVLARSQDSETDKEPQDIWHVSWIACIAPGQVLVAGGEELTTSPDPSENDLGDGAYRAYCRDAFGSWYRFEGTGVVPRGRDPRTFRSGHRIKRMPKWVRTGDTGSARPSDQT